MTISKQWIEEWKRDAGGAFSAECAHAVDVFFIDGQLKLMSCGHASTWPELVAWGFAVPVRRASRCPA